ncbi:MAG: hypothetical protein JWO31_3557, partial [Phycisphaerales bacterium]|nr:hypothetical protein [Phycisphaerales bacterium]
MTRHPSPPRLDYDPRPPDALRRRRRTRRWALRVGVALLLLSGVGWGPRVWRDVRERYWLDRCAAYAAPAGQVAYDEPKAAAMSTAVPPAGTGPGPVPAAVAAD